MEDASWDLLKNAAMAIASEPSDQIIVAAYFILAFRGLVTQPMVIHVILCNVFWFVSAIYPAHVYWLLCAISASYVTIFYYDNGLRAWIGSAVLTFLLAIMGMENVLAWFGWQSFFDALYDRYEVCVISIHVLIVCLLINWRKLLRYVGELANNLRNGQSRANILFSLV